MTNRPFGRVALAAALLTATIAHANMFELVGASPRSTSMSGAATADANDASAAFYNPAMLATQHSVMAAVAFTYLHTNGDVRSLDDSKSLDCTYCSPPDSMGFTVGLVAPLQGKLKDRLTLGIALHAPTDVVVRTRAEDPSRPFWYFYDNNPERLILFLGGGIHIVDGFDLGIGTQVLADLVGNGASMRVDTFSKNVQFREINSYLAPRVAPTAGLTWSPFKGLRLAADYRYEMSNYYAIPASVDLAGVGVLAFTLSGYNHYTPHTITVGGAFDPTEEMTLSLDAAYEMWSAAPTPYVDLVVDLSGDTLAALGLDTALDMTAPHTSPGMVDTVNFKLGYEYRVSDTFSVRAGSYFRPTPVPKQNVPGTNIMDGSRLGFTGGIGTSFHDPLEALEGPLSLEIGLQAATIFGREALKEATDSVPSYRYSAFVFAGQIGLSYTMAGDEKPPRRRDEEARPEEQSDEE